MGHSKAEKAESHERIVKVASERFREIGVDGIGVADLMKAAGLTHGAFYSQFASKDDLMVQACTRAFDSLLGRWRELAQQADADPLAMLTQAYLSPAHRDRPGEGCVLAALGAEASRQSPALRRAIGDGVREQVEFLAALQPGRTRAAKRQEIGRAHV